VELSPIAGAPGKRAYDIFLACFHKGVLVRPAGECLVLAPPYIVKTAEIEQMVATLAEVIRQQA
jgi:beta-alanine--pyruvate transaminase